MSKQRENNDKVAYETHSEENWLEKSVSSAVKYIEKRPVERRGAFANSEKFDRTNYR